MGTGIRRMRQPPGICWKRIFDGATLMSGFLCIFGDCIIKIYRMKIVEGFKLRKLGREYIVVGEGLKQVNFNKMISLNETAAYLWEEVADKEFTKEDLVDLLLNRYEVEKEIAEKDVDALLSKWVEAGLAK